ncbi:MAG: DUF420 domain-containing protein [Myxococcales bacterium]|nr:MAG: DUF420 domain-containing protein [Myxococcales bacterium]
MTSDSLKPSDDRVFFLINGVVSTAALSLIGYLLLVRRGSGDALDLSFMPAVNACLNATSACLLVAGYAAVRRRALRAHRNLMISALVSSALFLVGYLGYHYVHGDTKYPAGAPLRGLYLGILASHVLLSVVVVPMVLTAVYYAWQKRFAAHRRVTRIVLPIWLYVSVTGVVVFAMLRWSISTR